MSAAITDFIRAGKRLLPTASERGEDACAPGRM
jgi:hypothetical protein